MRHPDDSGGPTLATTAQLGTTKSGFGSRPRGRGHRRGTAGVLAPSACAAEQGSFQTLHGEGLGRKAATALVTDRSPYSSDAAGVPYEPLAPATTTSAVTQRASSEI
jgi:hypothetical protein